MKTQNAREANFSSWLSLDFRLFCESNIRIKFGSYIELRIHQSVLHSISNIIEWLCIFATSAIVQCMIMCSINTPMPMMCIRSIWYSI